MRYLEDLIREMDRKIAKNKERADKESAPRELRAEDQLKLTELKTRAKGVWPCTHAQRMTAPD